MLHHILEFFNQPLFELFGSTTSLAEVIGFVSGALCVYFVVKQNIWNFPLGIINAFFFMLLFYDAHLYADGTLQVLYLVLNALGWYAWLRFGPGRSTLQVSWADGKTMLAALLFVAAATAGLTVFLHSIGDAAPFWDALTTALSLAAQALLVFKKIQNWFFWIVADLIYIPLYFHKDLALTGIVYVLFLALCIAGFVSWRRSINATTVTEKAVMA